MNLYLYVVEAIEFQKRHEAIRLIISRMGLKETSGEAEAERVQGDLVGRGRIGFSTLDAARRVESQGLGLFMTSVPLCSREPGDVAWH